MKIKFTEDRGVYKKDQIVEVSKELGLQLLNTGKEGSAVEAEENAKVTSRNIIAKQIKAAGQAKAKEIRAKADIEDEK